MRERLAAVLTWVVAGARDVGGAVRDVAPGGPWWWLARAYLGVQVLAALIPLGRPGLWPDVLGHGLLTVPVLFVALTLSVRVGRDPSRVPRGLRLGLNAVVLVIGLSVLSAAVQESSVQYVEVGDRDDRRPSGVDPDALDPPAPAGLGADESGIELPR